MLEFRFSRQGLMVICNACDEVVVDNSTDAIAKELMELHASRHHGLKVTLFRSYEERQRATIVAIGLKE
ncbi:MAG TPA: hypothetical protein VFT12_12150 [Thermoanaerobaculia bacterium]|nr:hypothetical protein [Thermoanaerobaculia bacterium]